MKRVLVLGCGGSGKSTFALRLSELTGLPVVHLDAHHHDANWTPVPDDVWSERVAELAARDRWIMDGNYQSSMAMRLERADTVVLMDRNPLLCIYRILRRRIQWHGRRRPGAPEGAVERVDLEFIHYVLTWRMVRLDRALGTIRKHLRPDASFHHFRDNAGPAAFLRRIEQEAGATRG